MKSPYFFAVLLLCCSSQLFISCETTTSSHGYVATALDDENIFALFEISDRAVNERDYDLFRSLHAPSFRKFDDVERKVGYGLGVSVYTYYEYMDLAREFFRQASKVTIYTQITDIQIDERDQSAKVTVQEDRSSRLGGAETRTITLSEITVGFEDGWIFFEEWRDIAYQEIK